MARKGSNHTNGPPPPGAVKDSELFPFAADRLGPLTVERQSTSAKQSAAKPHYHDHRARLRQRFDEAGADALADYELLELLLFRTIPRKDTKPLAKALLNAFGDLGAVLGAPPQWIAGVDGAGAAVAQDLAIIQAILERAAKAPLRQRTVISSWSQLVNYCRLSMAHAPREQFRVLFLDVKNQLLADEILNEGTIDHAPVYPREIARRALELSAAAIILAHNHPSGDPKPSAADVAVTREVIAAANAVGVKVHDHLVIGRAGVESFKGLGLI